ncbi:MAG: 6-bladed beta-propeller [Fusobacteriaceae bacterium]|nr:6-bladed beta-propeller [Fusobacteriaceae bacterium]
MFSCNDVSKTKDNFDPNIYNLNVRNSISQNEKEYLISSMAKNITYVKLETNNLSFLERIKNVCITDKYIFVADNKSLCQFDKQGNFIRRIGRKGNGPGEFGNKIRFTVNKDLSEIYVLSHRTILNIFEMETGSFKNSFRVDLDISSFATLEPDKLVFFTNDVNSNALISTMYEAYLVNRDGKILDSIPDYTRVNNSSNILGHTEYYIRNRSIFYKSYFKDTLFNLDNTFTKRPIISYDFQNEVRRNKIEMDGGEDEVSNFISVLKTLENDKYFFITAEKDLVHGKKREFQKILFKKDNNTLNLTSGFKNDLDGGITFWPKFIIEELLVDWVEAKDLIEYYNATKETVKHSAEFEKLANSLFVNDNPILILLK